MVDDDLNNGREFSVEGTPAPIILSRYTNNDPQSSIIYYQNDPVSDNFGSFLRKNIFELFSELTQETCPNINLYNLLMTDGVLRNIEGRYDDVTINIDSYRNSESPIIQATIRKNTELSLSTERSDILLKLSTFTAKNYLSMEERLQNALLEITGYSAFKQNLDFGAGIYLLSNDSSKLERMAFIDNGCIDTNSLINLKFPEFIPLNTNSRYLSQLNLTNASYSRFPNIYTFPIGKFGLGVLSLTKNYDNIPEKNKLQNHDFLSLIGLSMGSQLEVQKLAYNDSLTGLPNRTYLLDSISRELEKCKRENSSRNTSNVENKNIGLLFLDLDNFKKINDTLGHKLGDETLKEVSKQLKSLVRAVDVVARIGGDEFVIMVPGNTNLEKLSEKISKKIKKIKKIGGVNLPDNFGVSIGSILSNESSNSEKLLDSADKKMYADKKKGKK